MALQNQEIGARLRELRRGRPQTAVADALEVSERAYQNWEAGDAKPSYRNLQRLAEYYGVGEEYILTGTPGGPPETPDLSRNATGDSQMDRIERKLDEVLQRLNELATSDDLAAAVLQVAQGLDAESSPEEPAPAERDSSRSRSRRA